LKTVIIIAISLVILIIGLISIFSFLSNIGNIDDYETIVPDDVQIPLYENTTGSTILYEDLHDRYYNYPLFSGYRGAAFDGKLVYFAPYQNNYGRHGFAVFYDTELPFNDPNSWHEADLDLLGGNGFQGALYHENYVYYVPYFIDPSNTLGSQVYRHNTNMDWDDVNSYDAMGFFGAYEDAVAVDNYVYFVPHLDKTGNFDTIPLRYNIDKPFSDPNSWEEIRLDENSSYIGAAFDGRYIYYSPHQSENDLPAPIMIYDTTKEFKNKNSWEFIPLEESGYSNVGFNGTHAIFASKHTANNIMFLNTETRELSFHTTNSIGYQGVIETDNATYLVPYGIHSVKANAEIIQITNSIETFTPKIAIGGYWGGTYDGKYVYFAPYGNGTKMHGEVLRYDTTQPFKDDDSWNVFSLYNMDITYIVQP
jgi:hypothetical protein